MMLKTDGICERNVTRTIESQTQPDQFYQGLANVNQTIAVFDFVACAALGLAFT